MISTSIYHSKGGRPPISSPSAKGRNVGFISPQAIKIHSYTQAVDTPKMSNGHHDNQNSPNSTNYFDRVRKESAGHTPFTIFDATASVPTHTYKNAAVGSSATLGSSNDPDEENKAPNQNVAASIPSRHSGQAVPTNIATKPKSSSSSGRSTLSSTQLRNHWERRGYDVDVTGMADSSGSRGQLGRLHNPRAGRLYDAPTPQKAVLKIRYTEEDKEKSKYYQAPFEVVRELKEMVMVQSQEIAQLKEDRDNLFNLVEDLEDQVAAASKPPRRKTRFGMKTASTTRHRMTLRRRNKNQN
ncbi:unnamed protein product [Cylindrotheca closterium]|uniref:Uncharacterized protein n=1 Tax=Cylindrotheca closterium TaxID=2856 RepID=A0AAD2FT82_9STRA|nr:unnamed protein product [Cylindrotheca closterium]